MFRKVYENTTWQIYNNIVEFNYEKLHKLKMPYRTLRLYARLISFYPMSEKQLNTFEGLDNNAKTSFLFNYLIKLLRKKGRNFEIKELVKTKKIYDNLRKEQKRKIERSDKMLMKLISKDYNGFMDMYLHKDIKSKAYFKLIYLTKSCINSLTDEFYDRIRKNTKLKKQEIDRQQRERETITENPPYGRIRGGYGIPDFRQDAELKGSIFDKIKGDISKKSKDVSEWDKFIEDEVRKRLKKKINTNYGKGLSRLEELSRKKKQYENQREGDQGRPTITSRSSHSYTEEIDWGYDYGSGGETDEQVNNEPRNVRVEEGQNGIGFTATQQDVVTREDNGVEDPPPF